MLAHDLAAALDPVLLARRAGVGEPDEWQCRALRSPAARLLMNCSRQSGKSTVAALLAVHEVLSKPGSLAVVVSPSQRQSGELFRTARGMWAAAMEGTDATPPDSRSAHRLELADGGRILSLPATEHTIRGLAAVDLMVIDEAARVPSDLYMALRPMLAVSGGRLLCLSTPFGTRGWWYEAWAGIGHDDDDDWERYRVPAEECPRIEPAFLEEEKQTMGEWYFRQEYGCEFLDAENAAFREVDVDAGFAEPVETWNL